MEELNDSNAATMPDGAMMDQNIADLFGEAADELAVDALGVSLPPSVPPSSAVVLRMMEKQNKGCCTRLAWSPAGSIAHIVDKNRHIALQAIIRHPISGKWYLSQPAQAPIAAPDGASFEHIQFSRVGVELAAIDNNGNVRIYSVFATLSKMHLAQSNLSPSETGKGDSDGIIALHWLPMLPGESKFPYISPATKMGNKWVTHLMNPSSNEAVLHHPAEKRNALFYVSRSARLTLMYQIESVWHATSSELEVLDSSSEQLTHAAMTEHGDCLMLVTHDFARRFRVYRITVNWNSTQNTRPSGPPYVSVNPALQIARLTVIEHVAAQHADLAILSDLRLVAPIPANIAEPTTKNLPTIVAVFTRVCPPGDLTQPHSDSFSIISRWNIEEVPQTVDEAFKKLTSTNRTPSQVTMTVLRRLDDSITSKTLMSVEPQQRGTILAFCASDATIEFRERATMVVIEPYGDSTTVSSLPSAGFEHTPGNHAAQIAMAPCGSMLVVQSASGKLESRTMSLRYGWQLAADGISDTRSLVEAAIICLAREYTALSIIGASNDDILACLPLDLSEDLRALFIRSIIEMQGRSLDLALQDTNKQNMLAIRENLLRSALSAQYVINRQPGTMKSNWSAKMGYAFLNARTVCTAIAQCLGRPDNMVAPTLLHGLRGLAKWGCEFLIYVTDGLCSLSRETELVLSKDQTRPSHEVFMSLAIERQSPVLNILLSSFTRILLRFVSVLVRQYIHSIQKSTPHSRSIHEKAQLEDTNAELSNLPFRFAVIDTFSAAIDDAVRQCYTSNNITPDRRNEIELSLLTEPTVPPELHPAVMKIVDTVIPTFMLNVDQGALYFRDTTWLGIDPANGKQLKAIDIMRKLPLAKGIPLRVCRRCGAVTEDPSPEAMRETAPVLMQTFRSCVCGNYWVLEAGKG